MNIIILSDLCESQFISMNLLIWQIYVKTSICQWTSLFWQIYVKASLYQGTEPLCEVQQTKEVDSTNPRWNQWLEFLYLPDLPRSAKICFSICSVSKKKSKKVCGFLYARFEKRIVL